MKLPTYQFVAQIGAAFAVVASLGLVAYELKQSRDLAVGELALSVYDAEADLYLTILDAEAYNRGIYKMESNGGELTWDERKNYWRVMMANQANTIAKFELWKLGLLWKKRGRNYFLQKKRGRNRKEKTGTQLFSIIF
jgi:hypothetical protein